MEVREYKDKKGKKKTAVKFEGLEWVYIIVTALVISMVLMGTTTVPAGNAAPIAFVAYFIFGMSLWMTWIFAQVVAELYARRKGTIIRVPDEAEEIL